MFTLQMDGPLARLRLLRPEARNAIPVAGWAELAALAVEAGKAARVLIVSGVPDGPFCAGADISDFERFSSDPAARTEFRIAMRSGIDALRDLTIPTIALIEGACYGAGVALAMACDVRIAGKGAQFAITPAKLGISYPQEDIHRLAGLAGPGQAARLLLTASPINGEEAARIGLVERWTEVDAAAEADEFALAVAANDPASVNALKKGLRLAAEGVRSDNGQDALFDELLGSEALTNGLRSHRERPR